MAGGRDIPFACDCGAVTGTLHDISASRGTHAICHCADCRAAEVFAGQPDPGQDGVDLFQTTPDRVEFHTGLDHIGVFSFSPNGLLRWYADCCGATLFNTLRNPKAAFSAIRVQRLADPAAIGPVRAHAFVGRPGGGYKHTGKAWFLLGLLRGPALARITGRWRDTPFFDIASGQPVRKVQIVDKGARADLLM